MNYRARRRWEANMGLGITEILLILLFAMLFFGWRNLIDLPRSMAQTMEVWKRRPQGRRFDPIVPMIMLASQDWSPGGWELIIILIIVLILFGVKNLPAMARGMDESIRNFKAGIQKSGAPYQQRQESSDPRLWWFLGLALIALAITLPVLSTNIFSDQQKTVLMVVLLCWIGVAYWTFGRNSRKG